MTDEDLRAMFDMAVSYIQYADWVEDDEVDTIRRIAEQMNVDPMTVTPPSHAGRFPHLAKPMGWVEVRGELRPQNCNHCHRSWDDEPHTGVEGDRRHAPAAR